MLKKAIVSNFLVTFEQTSKSVDPILKVSNISRVYKVGTEIIYALRSITLDIYKNEYVALMGSSGSGKSTLMNILGCLDTPTSGDYFLNGIDVSHMSDNELADIRNQQIGFVFQTFNLLPRSTALQNVALPLVYAGVPKVERDARAKKALEDVGLGDRITHRPNELSGGQRQRVAIARALVTNPAIILADEPTGNLDSKTSEEIMSLLHDIHLNGNTVIVVTHEEDIADHAHRIVRLKDGNVESDGVNPKIVNAKAKAELS
jgi:putative ABC transport system ATP-binding protein